MTLSVPAKNRIKDLRHARGLSSRVLATMIGTSAPHMSRLESGHSPLSLEWIAKLATALKVGSHEIIDLPFDRTFTGTCDEELLSSALDWLLEASAKQRIKLSRHDLSHWASYIYKEAVEAKLNFKQTKYLAFTIVTVIKRTQREK